MFTCTYALAGSMYILLLICTLEAGYAGLWFHIISLQVAILCGHHKVSGEISGFDVSQVGKHH